MFRPIPANTPQKFPPLHVYCARRSGRIYVTRQYTVSSLGCVRTFYTLQKISGNDVFLNTSETVINHCSVRSI